MADVVSPETRSRMMAGIRGKDTKPELAIRRALHKQGFRYRLHDRNLPGKPDMSFPRYKAVIMVNGCFWHRHDCHLFKWPSSRRQFWRNKINRNSVRDEVNMEALVRSGWRILAIWECALKGKTRLCLESVVEEAASWLVTKRNNHIIKGYIT
jgi:DNA mismatch endonuclease, patch repair protein